MDEDVRLVDDIEPLEDDWLAEAGPPVTAAEYRERMMNEREADTKEYIKHRITYKSWRKAKKGWK
jgi:hypothetical protein